MSAEDPTDPVGNDPDLPDPEFEPIRNFSALSARVRDRLRDGLFLALGHPDEHAIPVGALWGLLEHLDKLFQAVQVNKSGQEVNRRGALAAVPGGRSLEALPSLNGSYALPLRLVPPEGELVAHEYEELEALVHLLAPATDLEEELPELPERIGDELRRMFETLASSGTDMRAEVVRGGQAVLEIEVGAHEAQAKAAWLDEKTPHDLGTKTIRGKLFRIDTKKSEIRIDVIGANEGEANVEKASFQNPEQLDELREALNHQVEMEVAVSEDRRPYERSVTSPSLSVNWVSRIEGESE